MLTEQIEDLIITLNCTLADRNCVNVVFCCSFIAFLWAKKRKCKHSCLMISTITTNASMCGCLSYVQSSRQKSAGIDESHFLSSASWL